MENIYINTHERRENNGQTLQIRHKNTKCPVSCHINSFTTQNHVVNCVYNSIRRLLIYNAVLRALLS